MGANSCLCTQDVHETDAVYTRCTWDGWPHMLEVRVSEHLSVYTRCTWDICGVHKMYVPLFRQRAMPDTGRPYDHSSLLPEASRLHGHHSSPVPYPTPGRTIHDLSWGRGQSCRWSLTWRLWCRGQCTLTGGFHSWERGPLPPFRLPNGGERVAEDPGRGWMFAAVLRPINQLKGWGCQRWIPLPY